VLRRVEEENGRVRQFWLTDIFSQLRSFAIAQQEVRGVLEDGMASTADRSPASIGSRSMVTVRLSLDPPMLVVMFCPGVDEE
jgi:hypothetical protein